MTATVNFEHNDAAAVEDAEVRFNSRMLPVRTPPAVRVHDNWQRHERLLSAKESLMHILLLDMPEPQTVVQDLRPTLKYDVPWLLTPSPFRKRRALSRHCGSVSSKGSTKM